MKDRIYALIIVGCIIGIPIWYTKHREEMMWKKIFEMYYNHLKVHDNIFDYLKVDTKDSLRQERLNTLMFKFMCGFSDENKEYREALIETRLKQLDELEKELKKKKIIDSEEETADEN